MGMVKIHAQIMFPATPQRTAESLLVAPTPTIAPVIVWVVLTGIPATDAPIMAQAAAGFGAKTAHGTKFGNFSSHSFNNSPAAEHRSQSDDRVAHDNNPIGNIEMELISPLLIKNYCDYSDRFLRVVHAVAE